MASQVLIGVDIGGTGVRAGAVKGDAVVELRKAAIDAQASESEILDVITRTIDPLVKPEVAAIGVGVPSVVDVAKGIVYDTFNIPSWKAVPLKQVLEQRYRIPAHINNDSNCFVLGEKYFGKARPYRHVAGITLGTGMGTGLILDGRLYCGRNCGAGEFGMTAFRDQNYEYYCSGQFFANVYGLRGDEVANRAAAGDETALRIFGEFGSNLGKALQAVLYAVDPEVVVFGGSISRSFALFEEALQKSLRTGFCYRKTLENIRIEVSELSEAAVLGAAALQLDAQLDPG
jgi:glucokinase